MSRPFTAIIEREGDGFVSLCLELDIASQGDSVEEAQKNLREAVDLFFECASHEEVNERLDPPTRALNRAVRRVMPEPAPEP